MSNKKKTIAFGVAGEGRGHAARAIALSENLQEHYEIVIFAPSSIRNFLSDNLKDIKIINIPGINFHKENHVIRYRKTIIKNLTNLGRMHPEIKRLSNKFKDLNVDTVISDFEPYTAMAAKLMGLPVLNLNHPAVVLKYFSIKPDALAAKLAARIMMPPGTQDLICSFYGGDIGPIIRKNIKSHKPLKGDYFVVYTKEESREALLAAINKFPEINFRIFPNKDEDFTEALLGCRGVISSSGHQMLSEALFLEKPVLAFPQKMQFEQRLNAIMLERSGRGLHGDVKHIEKSVSRFINLIDQFPFRRANNEMFLFNDFTQAASNCIENFIEANALENTGRHFGSFTYRKNKPVQIKPA